VQQFQCTPTAVRLVDLESATTKTSGQGVTIHLEVVDDQQPLAHARVVLDNTVQVLAAGASAGSWKIPESRA
jgi:hypothetical protein